MILRRRAGAQHRLGAFTLVELLVVVSIIALLIAILLPSLKKARDQAKDAVDRSNLHQNGIALNFYTTDNSGRLPWIRGNSEDKAPYNQYYQVFYMAPYQKDLDVLVCPQAKSGPATGHRGGWGPRSVKGYPQPGEIVPPGSTTTKLPSYYKVRRTDSLWPKMRKRHFPSIPLTGPTYIEQLYTEYWYNDWGAGATIGGKPIPRISGGLVNQIPYPSVAVLICDAVNWNPRHHGGSHFLYVDAHVDWIKSVNYFDWEGHTAGTRGYTDALDKDRFGNRPYWSWGLARPDLPVNGDQ